MTLGKLSATLGKLSAIVRGAILADKILPLRHESPRILGFASFIRTSSLIANVASAIRVHTALPLYLLRLASLAPQFFWNFSYLQSSPYLPTLRQLSAANVIQRIAAISFSSMFWPLYPLARHPLARLILLFCIVGLANASNISLAQESGGPEGGSSASQTKDESTHESNRASGQKNSTATLAIPQVMVTSSPLASQLSKAPLSASVLSADDITTSGPDFLQQQIQQIPNFNYAGGTSRPRFFQIRGVGELEQYEGAPNSSVGVIVDDIDLTGVSAATTLYDVSQLEVLRGPQSVLFGSSALAGAISLRTSDPEAESPNNILVSAGSDHLFSFGGATGGPVVAIDDRLQFRVAAFHHYQDGFRNNEFLNRYNTNKREEFTGRAKLSYVVSDAAIFDLNFVGTQLDNGYDAFAIDNTLTTQSDRPGKDNDTLNLLSLRGTFDLGNNLSLVSITSTYKSDLDYSFDGDWGNNPFWEPFAPYDYFSTTSRDRTTFAQQFRLISGPVQPRIGEDMKWLVGAYLHDLNEDSLITQFADNVVYDTLHSSYEAWTTAIFGEIQHPILEQTSFVVGGRLENRATSYSDSRNNKFPPDDLMYGFNSSVIHELSQDHNIYLSLARGFRGGGFNVSTGVPTDRAQYDPENMITLESGTKASWLSGKLTTNVSAFLAWRRRQQLKFAIQNDPSDPLSFLYLTDNAARGRSEGLEAEATYLISDRLRLNFAASLLRARITSIDDATLSVLEGRDQSHAPRWQYSANSQYFLTDNFWTEVGVTGRAGFYFDDSNNERSSPYQLLNAGLGYSFGSWTLRLWGRNILDKRYAVRGFFFGNEPPDFPNKRYIQRGDPVAVGSTITYSF